MRHLGERPCVEDADEAVPRTPDEQIGTRHVIDASHVGHEAYGDRRKGLRVDRHDLLPAMSDDAFAVRDHRIAARRIDRRYTDDGAHVTNLGQRAKDGGSCDVDVRRRRAPAVRYRRRRFVIGIAEIDGARAWRLHLGLARYTRRHSRDRPITRGDRERADHDQPTGLHTQDVICRRCARRGPGGPTARP